MKIKDRLRGWITKQLFGTGFRNMVLGAGRFTMPQDFETYITDGYQGNIVVYTVVRKITQALCGIPWVLQEVKKTKRKEFHQYKSMNPDQSSTWATSLRATQLKNEVFEEVVDHPIMKLLARPNPTQSGIDFIEQAVGYQLVTGNKFILANRPIAGKNKGLPRELWIIPSNQVTIETEMNGIIPAFYIWNQAPSVKIPAEKILHQKYWNPDPHSRKLFGMSPIQAGRLSITHSNDSYQASSSLLQNVGKIGIITQSLGQGDEALTTTQAQKLQEDMKREDGVHNYGQVHVTTAPLQWQSMGMNAVDMDVIQANQWSKRDIAALYMVPSILIGDPEKGTYNNMKEAKKDMILQAALPELYRLRDGLNNWLVKPFAEAEGRELFLDIDISAIPELQEDLEKLTNQLSTAWWLKGNEKRVAMHFDEDAETPEMNEYMIPSNLMQTGEVDPEPLPAAVPIKPEETGHLEEDEEE